MLTSFRFLVKILQSKRSKASIQVEVSILSVLMLVLHKAILQTRFLANLASKKHNFRNPTLPKILPQTNSHFNLAALLSIPRDLLRRNLALRNRICQVMLAREFNQLLKAVFIISISRQGLKVLMNSSLERVWEEMKRITRTSVKIVRVQDHQRQQRI